MIGSIVMSERPFLNGRRWREQGVTSASAHPELISGDLAMAPRAHTPIVSNRSIGVAASRRTFGTLGVLAVVALLATVIFRGGETPDSGKAETQKFARACMQWHLAAGAAVARLLQSTRDVDLLLVSDSVFRIRRARRNCEAGWFTLACQDYHAVTASTPGYAMTNQTFPCSRVATTSHDRE
jgi:hypothetical protein